MSRYLLPENTRDIGACCQSVHVLAHIHPTSWKVNSANFACWVFSEVG
jgi:hypothetical protein